MAVNINKVLIAGNLTRDPDVKFLGNETAVANFGMALNETYRDKSGEKQESTTFVEIEVWGKVAELCGQYLSKGSQAFVEGKLKYDTWKDNDGKNQSRLKVKAISVQFMSAGKQEKPEQAPTPTPASEPSRTLDPADHTDGGSIPF